MSRIGNRPILVPKGVQVTVDGNQVAVSGPKGNLQHTLRPEVSAEYDSGKQELVVKRKSDEREARAYHGLTRSLIRNMVEGVANGYEKRLEIVGVGYLAAVQGSELQLRVGYANEVHKEIPPQLSVKCPDQTHVVIQGCDKQLVGQFAAEVRSVRKPEPYKGKGIRYQGEVVKIKPGKSAT
jgi:large subunit ribosomal protein L6